MIKKKVSSMQLDENALSEYHTKYLNDPRGFEFLIKCPEIGPIIVELRNSLFNAIHETDLSDEEKENLVECVDDIVKNKKSLQNAFSAILFSIENPVIRQFGWDLYDRPDIKNKLHLDSIKSFSQGINILKYSVILLFFGSIGGICGSLGILISVYKMLNSSRIMHLSKKQYTTNERIKILLMHLKEHEMQLLSSRS